MRLDGLMEILKKSEEFKDIFKNIKNKAYPVGLYGLSDSGRAYTINGIFEEVDKPLLILTHSDVEAKNLYEDLSFFIPNVYYFPNKEVVFYNVDAVSGHLRWERLKIMKEIVGTGKKIIITCIEAIASSYIPKGLYSESIIKFSVGKTYSIKEITEKLIQCGYQRVDLVEAKGEFSLRGGILDIYPPIYSEPYRIEFFGDEIDSIRSFNTESQRSIEKVKTLEIFPAKELILSPEIIEKGYSNIEKDLNNVIKFGKDKIRNEGTEKIYGIIKSHLQSLRENWSFETIDSFLPYFYEKTSSFLDYMDDAYIIMDDPKRCLGKLDSVYFEFEDNLKSFLQRGDILPGQSKLLIDKDKIISILESSKIITMDALAKNIKTLAPRAIVNFRQPTLNSYNGQLDLLINDIKDKKSRGFKTVILSGTRSRGERLVETLRDRDITSNYKEIINEVRSGEVLVTFGSLLKGFEYSDMKICFISDKEVFGESKRKLSNKNPKKGVGKIKSFVELKLGDFVVHANHGIGVFKGINQLEIDGIKKDYLVLSYDSDDKLYVPVEQLDMVQRYIGSEGKAPKVNKLSSSEWIKAKNKVKKSIEEIAQELVKLYATRATIKGNKFSKDTIWQKQFEEEFPYEETADQLTSIEEIKKDMESDKVMDRLLCGDVGYGKTEVAIRAAFKAVMDGKQVAVLVPTTILAQQHYSNFKKRFSDFPVNVDMISRFRTPIQQKETLKAVKEGNVDIIIGTHRLIQKDLQFKDLALLVIDEEQRFGVAHKEKIKGFKKNVDVLTLSATPIPRTLHMSLVGVRDISVIETAPEERYPIQTYVVEYNDQLIRDAILRELGRDGQVYIVYNRVETIEEKAAYIAKLVPEARVAVAHGQMNERELEQVILGFMNKEFDILVATTIIETGMDIQNVNTMIIYDSDKMGLSQLYQLRGRVGRTNRIAYCYLTYTKDKVLTEVAEKRLKAIKDFTELGSGFKIALKDLEIRGAGSMMGSSQHGHMASVGYDLYCRMLEDTIKLIKGDMSDEPIDTVIDVKVDAYIPSKYIADEVQKIQVYKKIAAIGSLEDYLEIRDELEDRFSNIPQPVNNLMNIAYLKSIAKGLGIEEIKQIAFEIVFTFKSNERISSNAMQGLIKQFNKRIVFKIGSQKPAFGYKLTNMKNEGLISELKEVLEYICKNS